MLKQTRFTYFSNFSYGFLNPNLLSNLNSNCCIVSKVSKFQKQIFVVSFEPKTGLNYIFDFCPKDLKWVKRKINASIELDTP